MYISVKLKITAILFNFNFDKIYTLLGVNSFSPEIMVGKNLGDLKGLGLF